VVFGFQLGLSCPDYDWSDSLDAVARHGVPLVITSSTLTEQCLELSILAAPPTKSRRSAPSYGYRVLVPPEVNAFASRQVLQSGTLANDVYYKNTCVAALYVPDSA